MSAEAQGEGAVPDEQLHPYVEWLFDADPILASARGDLRRAAELGEVATEARAEQQAQRVRRLEEARTTPMPPLGTPDWLEHQVLLTELATEVRRTQVEQVAERAPYWYTERLGEALAVLMADPADVILAEALVARLGAVPAYLRQARQNLVGEVPHVWAQMGVAGARGLEHFVGRAVPRYARRLPTGLATEVSRAATVAADAARAFVDVTESLVEGARGEWACGRDQFDFLLRTLHHLDLDAEGLAEYGRHLIEHERSQLERIAVARDRDASWQEQIDRIKDWHPQPEQFLEVYGEATTRVRRHTLHAELVTVPDDAPCMLDWVPEFRRDGLPLGEMETSRPYAPGLSSTFLLTPADPAAPPERRRQHMRDNCYVFVTSIAGHETFPGHHLQAVHHKLGTPRHSIRRYFSTPQFVEGWGLYVEDLLAETGFMADDRLRLVTARNALWRALRVTVDVGLHTGTMSIPEAVDVMRREAGMDEHMAHGEVRRYTRHDNPTYPSSYMVGRELIHEIRGARRTRQAISLREFHDWLLSFGSPPLPLLRGLED